MARDVSDLAVALNVMAGPDPRDPATALNRGRIPKDYTAGLKPGSLKGARLGLMRDFMKQDAAVDAVIESAVAILKSQGAEVVDVKIARYALGVGRGAYTTIRNVEFRCQIEDYLATLRGKDLPKTHADIIRLSEMITGPTPEGWVPNKNRLAQYRTEAASGTLHDVPYLDALNEGRKIIRDNFESHQFQTAAPDQGRIVQSHGGDLRGLPVIPLQSFGLA
jgi:amidase